MAEYYVSTAGSDSNAGTEGSPFRTIRHAVEVLDPGDVAYVRGGTYGQSNGSPITITSSGTANDPIRLEGYPGERPLVQWEGGESGWNHEGGFVFDNGASYWELRNFEIADSPFMGAWMDGSCSHNTLADLEIHDSGNSGVESQGDNTVIRNVTSHSNYDSGDGGENADGIVISFGNGGTIRDCHCYNNSDDGIDLWEAENVTVRGNLVHDNGRDSDGDGNGIKLGGGDSSGGHFVARNVSYNNRGAGFTHNGANVANQVYNNTAYNNGWVGFVFDDATHVVKNNISLGHGDEASMGGSVDHDHNTWNLGIDSPGFASTDEGADDFLRLSADSPVVDAGIDVGLSFSGDRPDLGAYEYSSSDSGGTTKVNDGSGWRSVTVYYHDGSSFQQV